MTVSAGNPLLGRVDTDLAAAVFKRLLAVFRTRIEAREIFTVVLACIDDLAGSPRGALPELLERLAHQRLLDVASERLTTPADYFSTTLQQRGEPR